jgi:AraC-like DNA-binding protein
MPESFHIAEEYRRLLGEFAGSVAPGMLPTSVPANEAGFDPLRPLPLGQLASTISRLRGTCTDIPIEWRLGEYLATNTTDLVSARALGSASIGEALIVAHQHQHIQSNVRSFTLRSGPNGSLTEFHHAAGDDPHLRFVFHSLLAAKIWLLFHHYKGSGAHQPIDGRAGCFGSLLHRFARQFDFLEIEFRDSEVVLNLSRNLLMQELANMGERQQRACDWELQRRSAEIHSVKRLSDRIRHHIRSSNFSEASIGDICDIFRVQRRSLGRMLREEGTNFTSILTELRRERALHLVGSTGVPLKRVAAELGFNSDASFNMAFKSWTGTTPARFRKAGSGRHQASDLRPPISEPTAANIQSMCRIGGLKVPDRLGPRWARASSTAIQAQLVR